MELDTIELTKDVVFEFPELHRNIDIKAGSVGRVVIFNDDNNIMIEVPYYDSEFGSERRTYGWITLMDCKAV